MEYCYRTLVFEEAYAISDFILDILVLVIPLPSVRGTDLSVAQDMPLTTV